jgi:amino acid transporter
MTTAADQGGDVFPWIMRQALSRPMYLVLSTGIAVTQYLCSLAALTSASRMAYAFARDGGLPQVMRHVSPKFSTPSVAIWVTATIGVAFTLVPKYDTISAACSIFVYIAYVIPAAVGLFAYGRTWTKMGPWDVGGWYRVLAVLSVVGCLVIIVIGVAPPNDLNRWIVGGPLALLTIVWFAFERHRFQGPPTGHAIEDRQAEIAEREQRSHIIEHIHDESVH